MKTSTVVEPPIYLCKAERILETIWPNYLLFQMVKLRPKRFTELKKAT